MDRFTKVLLFVASFSLLSSAVVYGQNSHARIVRISYLAGTTQINNQNVPLNSPLIEGNVLSTGVASFAEVEFEDGSRLRLGPDTQVTFVELSRSRSGEPMSRLDVEGEVELTMGEHVQQQFVLSGAGKNITMVRSGRVRVVSTKADPLEVTVWKGEAVVHDPDSGQDVNVAKNETFTLADDRQQYTVIRGAQADQLDRFCKLRDQYLEGEYVTLNQTPAIGSSLFATDPCSTYFAFPSLLQSCLNPYFNLYPYPYGYGYGYGGGYYFLPPPPRRRFPPIRPPAPVIAAAPRNKTTTRNLTKVSDAKHGGAARNSGRDHFSDARHSVPAGSAPHTGHTSSTTTGLSSGSHGYSGGSSMHSSGVSSSSGFSSHSSSSGASSTSSGGTGRGH